MSTELVAIERIIIGKDEKGAEQVRKDLARYLRQFLDTASIESMSLSAMVIKLDGKTALDIHNKTGGTRNARNCLLSATVNTCTKMGHTLPNSLSLLTGSNQDSSEM